MYEPASCLAVMRAVMETTPEKGERQRIRKKRQLVIDDAAKSKLSTLQIIVALAVFILFIWLALQVR